jgi:hypothetical protein
MSLTADAHLPTYEERRKETPLHPARCGPCEDCTEFIAEQNPRYTLWRNRENGTRIEQPLPTAEQLRRHAQRFDVEEVAETATKTGVPLAELAGLKADLREIAHAKRSRFGTKAKTAATNGHDARALYEAGLTHEEIAARLNWSLARVRNALRQGEET